MDDEKTMKKDDFGDRMKGYENVTRSYLLPRSYVFARIDGRSFHSYLKKCKRPFDDGVIEDMDSTAIYLCENVQNTVLGYVQSDEITLLLCDFIDYNTSQFFGGNIQKMSSVTAAMATAIFNQFRFARYTRECKSPLWEMTIPIATFDCRYWVVPSRWEAANTFIWRNQDCARNSVSMVAQSLFSHKELQSKSTAEMQEMLFANHGINWAEYDQAKKNGRLIVKETFQQKINVKVTKFPPTDASIETADLVNRTRWVSSPAWKFTEDKDKLLAMVPKYE